jgi:hypothetical protein
VTRRLPYEQQFVVVHDVRRTPSASRELLEFMEALVKPVNGPSGGARNVAIQSAQLKAAAGSARRRG